MELAIDTSTDVAGLALSQQGQVVAEYTWHCGQDHTAQLIPALIHVLFQARADTRQLTGIIVAKGPGSFNGVRVAMSTAKGLALALDLPLVGVSTLEAMAFPYAAWNVPICPLLRAGRGEVATALYQTVRGKWQPLQEEHLASPESLVSQIQRRTLFCGEIPAFMEPWLEQLGRRALVLRGASALRRAGFLAELGWQRLQRGDHDDLATLQPIYLRRPPITGQAAETTS